MKAVIFKEHGEVDRLIYTDFDEPKPGKGEVKIKVEACALNHLDIWVRLGGRPVSMPMPHISGSDVAGTVAEVGEDVEGIEVGQRVVAAPGLSCGQCEHCLTNNDSACDEFKLLGFQVQGGYAEYTVVPARNIIPVTDTLSYEQWASIPLVFVTAWHMLFSRGNLRCDENVLIQAAGSGVGIAAIQLAKLAGANVITTASTEDKLKLGKELGADEVINYREQDFVEECKRLTDGKGVDLIFDHIGGETFSKGLDALNKNGRICNCGITAGVEANVNLFFLFAKQLTIHGSYMGSLTEQKKVIKLAEQGKVKPVVDKVFPLQEAQAAQQYMLDRKNLGKIVLKTA